MSSVTANAGAQPRYGVDDIIDWEAKQRAFEAAVLAENTVDEGVWKSDVPDDVSWAYYATFGRTQGAGECETYAAVGVLEVQYVINNCEFYRAAGLIPAAVGCPDRPDDDDPSGVPFPVCTSWWDDGWHAGLDLSEQVVNGCSAGGYRDSGIGPGNDARSWLEGVGTTLDVYVPRGLPYVDYRRHRFWPPPRASAPGVLEGEWVGTCPLVDRQNPGEVGHGTCDIEELVFLAAPVAGEPADRWPFDCYPMLAVLPGAPFGRPLPEPSLPTFFRIATERGAKWESASPDVMFDLLADGHVLFASGGGHAYMVLGYEDLDGSDGPSTGDRFVVRSSVNAADPPPREPQIWNYGTLGVGQESVFYVLNGTIETYRGCAAGRLASWRGEDADGDRIPNGTDVCLHTDNACGAPGGTVADPVWVYEDADRWPDAVHAGALSCRGCDDCPGVAAVDRADSETLPDGTSARDGLPSVCDACPHLVLADQVALCGARAALPWRFDAVSDGDWDVDGDGIAEGDGLAQCCDGCPLYLVRGARTDTDGDGVYDACDPCRNGRSDGLDNCDADRDGFHDLPACTCSTDPRCSWLLDSCPVVPNPALDAWNCDQPDLDRDAVGDACDNCLTVSNTAQADVDGDDFGNACDNCPDHPNADQHDCNLADSMAQDPWWGNPDHFGRGDACDWTPCVDLCMRPVLGVSDGEAYHGDPTLGVPRSTRTIFGRMHAYDTEPLSAAICPVGGERPTSPSAAVPPMPFPTQVRGCWCENSDTAECESNPIKCPGRGANSGRWKDADYPGRCLRICTVPAPCSGPLCPLPICEETCEVPEHRYAPLYAEAPALGFGRPYDLTSGYVPYYSDATRRTTQSWSWISDFGPSAKWLQMWFRPDVAGWFTGFGRDIYGNTYTGWVHADGTERPIGTVDSGQISTGGMALVPTGRQFGPAGEIVSPGQAFADLLWSEICPAALDCPWPDWFFFPQRGDQVRGILVASWDPSAMAYRSVTGSVPLGQEQPDGVGPAIAFAYGSGGDPVRYWLFGGRDALGRPTSQFWSARLGSVGGDGMVSWFDKGEMPGDPGGAPGPNASFVLRREAEAESWPSARFDAAFVRVGSEVAPAPPVIGLASMPPAPPDGPGDGRDGTNDVLVLAGGEGATGLLDDVWSYHRADPRAPGDWRRAGSIPGVDGGLAEAASVQIGRTVYLAGGRTRSGPTSGVWRISTDTGETIRVPVAGPAPSPRRRPAVTYDAASGAILLYGGVGGAGVDTTDVWAFDPVAAVWTRRAAPCAGSGCPPATGREALWLDVRTGGLTVVGDRSDPTAVEGSWVLLDGVWHGSSEARQPPGPTDCGGGGPGLDPVGARCGAGGFGYPSHGRLVCDGSSTTCRAPAAPGAVLATYRLPAAQALDADDAELVVARRSDADLYAVAPDGGLTGLRTVRLPRQAHDVALFGTHLLVADGAGFGVYRRDDGREAARIPTCGAARRIFVDGTRAWVVGLRSVLLLGLSDPARPQVLAQLRLHPSLEGLQVTSGTTCGWSVRAADVLWDLLSPAGGGGRDVAAFSDGRLFLNLLGRVHVLDFRAETPEAFVRTGPCVGLLRAMRAEGPYLYATSGWGWGIILARDPAGDWVEAGPHDVHDWTAGVVETSRHAFRWGRARLDVARRQ